MGARERYKRPLPSKKRDIVAHPLRMSWNATEPQHFRFITGHCTIEHLTRLWTFNLIKFQEEKDYYCWLCHKEGDNMVTCELCPRAFHSKCLGIVPASEDWVCPECEVIGLPPI